MIDPETDPRRHRPPLLTMHTNTEGDRLWMTCDCGWSQGADYASPEEARDLSRLLLAGAKAHWAAAHGADFPTVR